MKICPGFVVELFLGKLFPPSEEKEGKKIDDDGPIRSALTLTSSINGTGATPR